MGLLKDWGIIYSYDQSQKYQHILKQLAVKQFLEILRKYKDWQKQTSQCDCQLLWGDQIQGHRLLYDQIENQFKLSLTELPKVSFPMMPEFGRWMFEIIPNQPHKTKCNFDQVIESFRGRYKQLNNLQEFYLTIPNIPFLGTDKQRMIKQNGKFQNSITQSLFVDDNSIALHPRYKTLAKHIRQRKGKKVKILAPIFVDQNTKINSTIQEPFPGYIYMDAMTFGMGMACLQCTFSTKNISHARYIYDQLHILSPLFLSLTAGTPIFKGKLSNWDVRWKVLQQSVDDRTEQELDIENEKFQLKSRYSSSSYFISQCSKNLNMYNDLKIKKNEDIKTFISQYLEQKKMNIDQKLRDHIEMLSSRDFLIMHQKFLEMDQTQFYLFQMLNSTNWNSARFKIPIDDTIGWRVEFRTMEIQLTADQNAAFSLLIFIIVLMLNQIPNLNFYIPMSKIDENFDRAHQQNSILKKKFYFRTNIYQNEEPIIKELTLNQIFFGSVQNKFSGLFYTFRQYFENPMICKNKKCQISHTLKIMESIQKFIKEKVTGERITLAQWMRNFVRNHKDYKKDSIVNKQINTDMLKELIRISRGESKDQNFRKVFN